MFKKYKTEIIIFIVALALRLAFAFFLYGAESFNSDKFIDSIHQDGYYEIAYNLIQHKVFSDTSPDPTAPVVPGSLRAPGYPLMLAASWYVFNSLWPLLIIQIIVGSVLPVLGRRISRQIAENKMVANFVAWLLVVEPVGIWLSVWMMTETFFTLFFFLAVLFIIKFIKTNRPGDAMTFDSYKIIGWSAFFLGLATLIRTTTYYFPLVIIAAWLGYSYFLKSKLFFKEIIIFLVIFILILSPWLYRNYQIFGVVSLSSQQEDVLFDNLAPSVLSEKNQVSYAKAQADFFKSEGIVGVYPMVTLDKASWFRQRAVEVLKQHPKELAIVSGVSLLTFFTHDGMLGFLGALGAVKATGLTVRQLFAQPPRESLDTIIKLFFSPVFFIILVRAFWILIAVLFLLNIIRSFFRKKFTALSVFALICIAYFAFTTLSNGYCVNARFRFPVNVFILMFAINFLYDMVNSSKRQTLNLKIIK